MRYTPPELLRQLFALTDLKVELHQDGDAVTITAVSGPIGSVRSRRL
jgi:hypothetical protein